MSQNSETNHNNSPKRVRFQEQPQESTTDKSSAKAKSPKAIALACVSGHVASLHPHVAKIVTSYAEKHVNLYAKLEQKKTQVDRMNKNVDFIPRSARINFEFYVRPQVKEMQDFAEIQSETEQMIGDFQQNLKNQIVRVAIMECNLLKRELNENLIHLIHHTTKALHLQHNPDKINHTVTTTIAHIMNGHGETILKHSTMNTNVFKTYYAELYNDTSINNLNSGGRVFNANNPNNPYSQQATLSQTNSVLPSHLGDAISFVDSLCTTLETILCTSIDTFINQVQTNKITNTLEAYGSEILLDQATADTTNHMDLSRSVAPEELQELVKKSTATALSSLTKEIQSLRDKLKSSSQTQKNSPPRGNQSASLKKKSSRNHSKSSVSKSTQISRNPRKQKGKSDREKPNRDSENASKNKSRKNQGKTSTRQRQRSRSNKRNDSKK